MVECCVGLNAVREQLVDQSIVEIETFRIGWTIAVRKYTRPGNREAISLDAERLHQLHVSFVKVVMVVSNVAVCIVNDSARRVRESVPNGWTTSVFFNGALHLIRSGCRSPDKCGWKSAQRVTLWQSV